VDFFGRTVNFAVRVQGESVGGDIVLAKDVFATVDAEKTLREFPYEAKNFSANLKGFSQAAALTRLVPK